MAVVVVEECLAGEEFVLNNECVCLVHESLVAVVVVVVNECDWWKVCF